MTSPSPESRVSLLVEPVRASISLEQAVVRFSYLTGPSILESSLEGSSYGCYSILACDPLDEFTLEPDSSGDPFEAFAQYAARYPAIDPPPSDLPFGGGWIGYFTYEAGLAIERIRSAKKQLLTLPLVHFRLYDTAAVYDHQRNQWYAVAVDWGTHSIPDRSPAAVRIQAIRQTLRSSPPPATETTEQADHPIDYTANMTRSQYDEKVTRAKHYIEAGDIYQVNLTQRFTVHTTVSPLSLYLRLRKISPSSHAALLLGKGGAVLSSSPELFLQLRGGQVVTRPIKGTRPRSNDPARDLRYRRELKESEKEHAELAMIVDLLRNDLGRVCRFGSIRVVEPAAIEVHPTVYHRAATIEGKLAPGRTWLDLLRATCPGGSITGAPKIRAMEIIEELEPTPRGIYCGSIGMIGLDGSLSLNIAIRTMLQQGSAVYAYAGGAIVADSTAEREYDEMMAKAAGMLRALRCRPVTEATHCLKVPIF